jgi:hypothetical protein
MKTLKLSPMKRTIKIHSVFGLNENKIACRNASFFCENCYKDGLFSGQCDGWEYHTIGVYTDCMILPSITLSTK